MDPAKLRSLKILVGLAEADLRSVREAIEAMEAEGRPMVKAEADIVRCSASAVNLTSSLYVGAIMERS